MENEHIFEAEAGLEANEVERMASRDKDRSNAGVKVRATANGAYDKRLASSTAEESPLLPRGPGNERRDGSGDEDSDSAGARWPGEADIEDLPWWKKPSVYWLLPAYAIWAVAMGGIWVPRINLVLSLICREYLAERSIADPSFTFAPVLIAEDNLQCQIPEVQALSSRFLLYVGLIGGVLAAVTSPKIGALSDRFGRKPLLAFTSLGGLTNEAVTILAATYPDSVHYSWILAASVIDGICGSFIAGAAMGQSYATDCTAPAKRAIAFGYLHACLFVGIAIGPLFAAAIIKKTDSIIMVFYFGLAVQLLFLIYVGLVLPESVSKKRQMFAREKHAMMVFDDNSFLLWLWSANILAPLKILYPTGEGSSPQLRTNLLMLSAVSTILFGTAMASMTVVILYAEYEFGWSNNETNIFVSIANSTRVFALVGILPLLNYLVRTRYRNQIRRESGIELIERNSGSDNLDLWTIRSSVILEIIGFGGYCLVRTGPLFVMSAVFASFGGIGAPILQSALTKHVPHDRVGQLLGAIGLLHALARVMWPTGVTIIYSLTVATFPQAVFLVLVGCFCTALFCSMFIRPHIYLDELSIKPSTGLGILGEEDESAAE